MDGQTQAELKIALIALVRRGQADEEAFRASLSDEERNQVGTAEEWAPKEVIAHLGYWKRRQVDRLESQARGDEPPAFADFEQLNTESWPEHARLTWDESVERSDAATRDLIAAIQVLPDTPNGESDAALTDLLTSSTLGNSYGHIGTHISDYYLAHGEKARAISMQRSMLDAVTTAHLGGGAESGAHYNLACFFALNNMAAEALDELRQAFPQRPDLIAWAREDHDLDSLRETPEFQALVPPEG
jgi:hypothetical protein